MNWSMLPIPGGMGLHGVRAKDRHGRRYRPTLERLEDRTVPANLAPGFSETAVATGLNSATAMEIAPDGKLFVAEQGGTMEVWTNGSKLRSNFFQNTSLAVAAEGECGLLGIAFDPGYASNRFIYVYYTTTAADRHNRVSRFTANAAGDLAVAGSEVIIWEGQAHGASNHNGGAIHFGADGKLYIATGDNANGNDSQSLSSLHGKVLRINANGTIPSDNPFFNQTTGAFRAIWARGLRNPFTFSFRQGTNEMFINDVGQNTWEEINAGAAGANYGWPTTEGDFTQGSFPGFTRPFYTYDHGGADPDGCAITGGAFYNPTAGEFPAEYFGDYLFADFCGGWINRIDTTTKQLTTFATGISFPVDLKVDDTGRLYYLARGSGEVFQISCIVDQPPTVTGQPADQTTFEGRSATFKVYISGTFPLTYQWQRNDGSGWSDIAGAAAPSYTLASAQLADSGVQFRCQVANDFGNVTSAAAALTVTPLQPGLRADFVNFNRVLSSMPSIVGRAATVSRVDAQVNYAPANGAWPGLDARFIDTFVSRHTGFIDIPLTGNHTFYLRSDDGSKLWIDGQLLIDNNGVHGMLEKSATRMLTAGLHEVHIKYFENTGPAGLRLFWSGPGIVKQIVPAGAFFHHPPPAALRSLAVSALTGADNRGALAVPAPGEKSTELDANDVLLPFLLDARIRAMRGLRFSS